MRHPQLRGFVIYQLMPIPGIQKPDPEKRPTLRAIAGHAGVTHATVSMALRNHPLISVKTRRKIQRIARQLGYRPDPEVAKLMHHLRMKHKPRFKSTIAALTNLGEGKEPAYAVALREGAQRAAEGLGYGFSVFRVEVGKQRDASLQRILRSRGVEGLMLLPMREAIALGRFLDWKQFSVVAATYGVVAPDFHRVIPDQFGNTLLICRQLARLGCRRIGLVEWSSTGPGVDNRFSAAVMWQNTMGGTEFVRAFIYENDIRDGLKSWYADQRPDGMIVGTERDAHAIAGELGPGVQGKVRFAVTGRSGPTPFGGIDQRAAAVAAAAAAQLHGLIQRGEKGLPTVAGVMMIKGHWVQAPMRRSGANAVPVR